MGQASAPPGHLPRALTVPCSKATRQRAYVVSTKGRCPTDVKSSKKINDEKEENGKTLTSGSRKAVAWLPGPLGQLCR